MGPARVAVTAISPNPFFVIATSALMSPREFPQERTVKFRREGGNVVMKPSTFSKSTIAPAVKLIQATLNKKQNTELVVMNHRGASVLLILVLIKNEHTSPGKIKIKSVMIKGL